MRNYLDLVMVRSVTFPFGCLGKKQLVIGTLLLSFSISAQSDLDRILKGGELVIGGLSIFKILNSDADEKEVKPAKVEEDTVVKPISMSKVVTHFCVKNKLTKKIVLQLMRKNEEGETIEKELIVQNNDKECLFEVPKGVWSYQIVLEEEDGIYKKGEYNLVDDETIIIIKED